MNTKQAMQEIVEGKHGKVGYIRSHLLGYPEIVEKDGWYDLSEGDHEAQVTDEGLVLALWFNWNRIALDHEQRTFPILNTKLVDVVGGKIKMVKISVVVPETGLDYVYVEGRRTYFNKS